MMGPKHVIDVSTTTQSVVARLTIRSAALLAFGLLGSQVFCAYVASPTLPPSAIVMGVILSATVMGVHIVYTHVWALLTIAALDLDIDFLTGSLVCLGTAITFSWYGLLIWRFRDDSVARALHGWGRWLCEDCSGCRCPFTIDSIPTRLRLGFHLVDLGVCVRPQPACVGNLTHASGTSGSLLADTFFAAEVLSHSHAAGGFVCISILTRLVPVRHPDPPYPRLALRSRVWSNCHPGSQPGGICVLLRGRHIGHVSLLLLSCVRHISQVSCWLCMWPCPQLRVPPPAATVCVPSRAQM